MRALRLDVRRAASLLVVAVGLYTASGLAAHAACVGDCNNDNTVAVDERLALVSIALGNTPLTACKAGDANGDLRIAVNEITAALAGCPPAPTGWVLVDPTTGLQDVWGAAPNDIFAVGGSGIVRHFDGNTWSGMQSGTMQTLLAVWGFSPADVYAVGFNPESFGNPAAPRGIILHFDGTAWSEVVHGQTDTFFRDVWGTAPDDVFVVGGIEGFGTPGVILHYDGASWTQQLLITDNPPHNQLRGVWGFARDDVYAVGSGGVPIDNNPGVPGLTLHYDGHGWTRMPSVNGPLNTVWGSRSDDVYASGGPTGIIHFDGAQWSALAVAAFGAGSAVPIWGFGPSDIFFGLFHFDGATFVLTRDPETRFFTVTGLWGPPDGGVILGAGPDGVWRLQR